MINKEKIILTVSKHLENHSGNSEPKRPDTLKFETFIKKISGKPSYDMKRRMYEIINTDDYGKYYFGIHHLKKALCKIKLHQTTLASLTCTDGSNPDYISALRMVMNFLNVIDERIIPGLKALSEFSTPNNEILDEYLKLAKKYQLEIQIAKNSVLPGKGKYQKLYEAIAPIHMEFLCNLIGFLDKTITKHQI